MVFFLFALNDQIRWSDSVLTCVRFMHWDFSFELYLDFQLNCFEFMVKLLLAFMSELRWNLMLSHSGSYIRSYVGFMSYVDLMSGFCWASKGNYAVIAESNVQVLCVFFLNAYCAHLSNYFALFHFFVNLLSFCRNYENHFAFPYSSFAEENERTE